MNKYPRQMRMQQTAVGALRRDPSLISDTRIRDRLDTIAGQTFGQPYSRCIDLWKTLLRNGDVDEVSRVVLQDSEFGGYLRTVSPLGVLITPEQRRAVAQTTSHVAQK